MRGNQDGEQDGGGAGGGSWFPIVAKAGLAFVAYKMATSAYDYIEKFNRQEKRREREKELQNMKNQINEIEELLQNRQELFCSYLIPKFFRKELEKKIMEKAETLELERDVKKDLKEIFLKDDNCASDFVKVATGFEMKHGKLMWEKTEEWRNDLRKTIRSEGFENLLQEW